MKLGSAKNPVEVNGGGSTSQFSIAMNAKAFRVLSDSLYQNKVGSIVREISCNAMDSHIAAGTPELPFVVHLPDNFEPWFSVQDFGVGLTPEQIETVFTKYFESSKDDSNQMVGAFGLGGKSPFSYTDQFTVTSVTGGMKRMYSAYITEQGIPAIVEMSSEPTTEHNGVEIKLSAKREDYNKFANETAEQLRFFKVKPKILNRANFRFKDIASNLVIDSRNCAISSDSVGYGESWAYIIQGSVGYPLDLNQVREKISADNRKLLDTMNGSSVRFYFNIGEIGVTASREGVEYNKHTLASIERKLGMVRIELTKYIDDKMVKLTSDYEKALFLNSSTAINRLARAAGITLPNVKTNNAGHYYFDFADMLMKTDPVTKKQIQIGSVKSWQHGRTARDSCYAQITPNANSEVQIVFRDTNSKPNIRAKFHLSQLDPKVSLIEVDIHDHADLDDAFIAKLKVQLGGFDKFKRLSDVVLPMILPDELAEKVRSAYSRPTHYSHNGSDIGGYIRSWNREFDALADMDDDVTYVIIEDMALVKGGDAAALRRYVTYKEFDKANVLDLVGIRSSDVKKIAGKTNFIPLQDYMDGIVESYSTDKKLYINWRHSVIGQLIRSKLPSSLRNDTVMKALDAQAHDAIPTKALFLSKRLTDRMEAHGNRLAQIGNFMGWDAEKLHNKYEKRVTACVEGILNRYPLLRVFNEWQIRNHITPNHLAKYVSVM